MVEKLRGKRVAVRRAFDRPMWLAAQLEMIESHIVTDAIRIPDWEKREALYEDIQQFNYLDDGWRPIQLGEHWGAEDHICFFRRTVTVPPELAGKYVAMRFLFGGESTVYVDGRPANGLDPNRELVPLTPKARGGETFDILVESHVWSFPDDVRNEVDADEHVMQRAEMVAIDKEVESAYFDLKVAYDAAMALEARNKEAHEFLIGCLDEALGLVDRYEHDRDTFLKALRAAAQHARETVYESDAFRVPGKLWLVGHSHLDIAFHWALRHGARKAARTTTNMIALMDEFPDFRFCQTQPWTFLQIKRHWPKLWTKLKKKVKSGQWEMVGGMWIEPDLNLPSGESLVRQLLYGKRFLRREFGVDTESCFLPDVFGASWILPQILRRAGCRFFVTHKQSTWNDTNLFPNSLFWWKGVDGTAVLACIPSSHFIGRMTPEEHLHNWQNWRQKKEFPESMYNYGFGDGGGGATRQHIEYARRMKRMPGFPEMEISGAEAYLDRAWNKAKALPTWEDELYLEMHRGTPTTKGHLKRWNRLAEQTFREAEVWSALDLARGGAYPHEKFNDGWDKVLTNHFHDIIPGSHTEQVAEEAYMTFPRNLAIGRDLRGDALKALAARIDTASAEGAPIVVFNALPWARTEAVELEIEAPAQGFRIVDVAGQAVDCQVVGRRGKLTQVVLLAENVPSVGYKTLWFVPADAPRASRSAMKATKRGVENAFFRLRFDRQGCLSSIFDKRAGRELVTPGEVANRFQLFEDKPGIYDAWDIVRFYKEHEYPVKGIESIEVVENGPVRTVVRVTRKVKNSRITQDVILYAKLPRIAFRTKADWRERQKLLKVAFPVDIHARTATYDIDFGSVERPAHHNTSWDEAKYEVCAHKWADYGEGGYGVSLLNDCKYGHDICNGTVRLTLLKGSVYPDEFSDLGVHEFTYYLYPHAGDWREAGTVALGHGVNAPLQAISVDRHEGALPAEHSFVQVNRPNVMLVALKKAEDDNDLIVRLVELHNERGEVEVRFADEIAGVVETNLLEEEEGKVASGSHSFRFDMRPFELRTFKITLARM